jgi:multimeric flavodoxin WrbA
VTESYSMLTILTKRKYMDSASNKLLIVYHSKSGTVKQMADAIISGATTTPATKVELVNPLKVTPETVKTCQAIIIGTPENFGYMSGPIKYFFEEIYYDCIECTRGLSYALFVAADNDGSGAVSSMKKIITGLGWNNIAEPMICKNGVTSQELELCRELGMTVSAGLELGLY